MNAAEKYKQLDEAILAFIADTKAATVRNGVKATMTEMMVHPPIAGETQRLSVETGPDRFGRKKPPFRFLDGRLQAMRRAGKIHYGTSEGWVMVERRTA